MLISNGLTNLVCGNGLYQSLLISFELLLSDRFHLLDRLSTIFVTKNLRTQISWTSSLTALRLMRLTIDSNAGEEVRGILNIRLDLKSLLTFLALESFLISFGLLSVCLV